MRWRRRIRWFSRPILDLDQKTAARNCDTEIMVRQAPCKNSCWLQLVVAAVATAVLALVAACQSSGTSAPIGEDIPAEPLLLATDAYRGADQYFLRYCRGDEVFYAAGRPALSRL